MGQARQWQAAQGRGSASPTLSVVVAPAVVLSVDIWHTLHCEAALAEAALIYGARSSHTSLRLRELEPLACL